jgi:hypothetical protein
VVFAGGVDVNAEGEVGVEVGMKIAVSVIAVEGRLVLVGFGLRVEVAVDGMNRKVLVGLAVTTTVLVAEEAVVGAGETVSVARGNGVLVVIVTPGVRKLLNQLGGVRIEASIGSINSSGPRVRKALFGSR